MDLVVFFCIGSLAFLCSLSFFISFWFERILRGSFLYFSWVLFDKGLLFLIYKSDTEFWNLLTFFLNPNICNLISIHKLKLYRDYCDTNCNDVNAKPPKLEAYIINVSSLRTGANIVLINITKSCRTAIIGKRRKNTVQRNMISWGMSFLECGLEFNSTPQNWLLRIFIYLCTTVFR